MLEKLFDINAPGFNIRCKLYANAPRGFDRLVIYIHGFAGHKETAAAARFSQILLEKYKSAAVLCFDLPCHGNDIRKKFCLSDCCDYLTQVLDHARRQYEKIDLCCYATSFGGYLALYYLSLHSNPFRKIVLRSPAIRFHDVMSRTIISPADHEVLAIGKDISVGFDRKIKISPAFLSEAKDADISALDFMSYADDILICHGSRDELVPIEDSRSFADDNVMEFVEIPGADHRFQNPARMTDAIKLALGFMYK